VRTPKESQRVRDTHLFSWTEIGTGEDAKRKPESEGYSQSVEHRWRDNEDIE
jgi:hypothetical protein